MKRINQKGFSVLIIVVILVIFTIGVFLILFNKSKLNPKNGTTSTTFVKVKLIDAYLEKNIALTDVNILSDNGIRCVAAPCPTNTQKWSGKTDKNGLVEVPQNIINSETNVSAEGYKNARNLFDDSEKIDNIYILELDPSSKIDSSERRLKIIDSTTNKPINGVSVWITNSPDCRPKNCNDYSFTEKANGLGNIYYPLNSVKFDSWVYVEGYKVTKKPNGYKEYKVLLEKE